MSHKTVKAIFHNGKKIVYQPCNLFSNQILLESLKDTLPKRSKKEDVAAFAISGSPGYIRTFLPLVSGDQFTANQMTEETAMGKI